MLPNHAAISSSSASASCSLGAFKVNGAKRPSVDQEKLAKRAEEQSTIIEEVVGRVYDFARVSAQHLANVCGREEDHYLRLIFHRGAILHPMPEQEPLSSCQFTRCESPVYP